jgi:hypothetical protein
MLSGMASASKAGSGSRLARLLNRLARVEPGSASAIRLKALAERALLVIVKAGGRRGADAAIKAVRIGTQRMSLVETVPRVSSKWRATVGATAVPLDVWFAAGQIMQATYVQYGAPAEPKVSAAQRAKHEAQEAFYARYTAVGQRWYRGLGPRRLSVWDNRILLIGELEADVNNGGFSQYLDNKGRRRAKAALAALRAVGATKTAGMLKSAMAAGVKKEHLDALDARFYKVPEDLAVLTMRRLKKR